MSPVLGFSISCYKGDVPLLRGCLESIRYFAPDAPICLIVDGDFSTQTLERAYGVQVIRRADVTDPGLRRWSFGFGFTKMVAFWESPFDIVFHIDADTVLWGDIRKNLPTPPWDVVYNEPHEVITPAIQLDQYFDPARIFEVIEPFPWEGNPYFNSGTLCVRRGALDLDEYLRLLELQRKHPDIISFDQGLLNILVFRAVHEGKVRASAAHLQTIVALFSKAELEARFRIEAGRPVIGDKPSIIHWAGIKPWQGNDKIFSRSMNFFRQKAMQRCGLPAIVPLQAAMAMDEFMCRRMPKYILAAKKTVKRALGRPV